MLPWLTWTKSRTWLLDWGFWPGPYFVHTMLQWTSFKYSNHCSYHLEILFLMVLSIIFVVHACCYNRLVTMFSLELTLTSSTLHSTGLVHIIGQLRGRSFIIFLVYIFKVLAITKLFCFLQNDPKCICWHGEHVWSANRGKRGEWPLWTSKSVCTEQVLV